MQMLYAHEYVSECTHVRVCVRACVCMCVCVCVCEQECARNTLQTCTHLIMHCLFPQDEIRQILLQTTSNALFLGQDTSQIRPVGPVLPGCGAL